MPPKYDRWPELCELVEENDGLPVRSAGPWTEKKVHFWSRYLDITTSALVDNEKCPGGLTYLDLFAGPGICQSKESGKRYPGSVLVAANQLKPFYRLIACEKDSTNANALETRLSKSPLAKRSTVIRGDCNERIDDICNIIPEKSLTLAFIDPESLHAHFATLKRLTTNRKVDLLILFPDSYDIVRNVLLYASQEHSKLDDVLGNSSEWRKSWSNLPNHNRDNLRELFTEIYKEQIRKELNYSFFGHQTLLAGSTPLYKLIYASRDKTGLKFWDIATSRDVSGSRDLFQ